MALFDLLRQMMRFASGSPSAVATPETESDHRSGPYTRGRPFRFDPLSGDGTMPLGKPGMYIVRNQDNERQYIGETCDLMRRINEHLRIGDIQDCDTVDYMVADGRSSSKTRRIVESQKISIHRPPCNQRGGGGGRRSG